MTSRLASERQSGRPNLQLIWLALAAFLIAGLVLITSLAKRLDHDEHQFVASAYLFANHGLLPYLDYAYFHVPNLVPTYGILFRITDHLLLSSRLFSATCSLVTLGLIAGHTARLFRHTDLKTRLTIALGSVVALIGSPFFIYTSGLAWNHDASVLLSLAAVLALLWSTGGRRRTHGMVVSGALLGLAIGTRLTVITLLPPMLTGAVLLGRNVGRQRESLHRLGWFGGGLFLALTPLLLLLATAPQDFFFGNLKYAFLNTAYREATGYTSAMSTPGKILLFLERVVDPGNLVIFLLLGYILYDIGRRKLREEAGREVVFLITLVAFTFLGSLAPTPAFTQYFYAVVPFSLVAALRGMAILDITAKRKAVRRLFTVTVIICALRGLPSYAKILSPLASHSPVAMHMHARGLEIRDRVGSGKVLTLAPIYPLEGGLEIYRQFVTGPFAWRTADLLPTADRERYGMVGPEELPAMLHSQPPAAILTGVEPVVLERPLIEYARSAGFQPVTLDEALTLWVASCAGPCNDNVRATVHRTGLARSRSTSTYRSAASQFLHRQRGEASFSWISRHSDPASSR